MGKLTQKEVLPEEKIVPAINEAAKSVGAQSLTFFVAAAYITFSAASVRDEFFIFHDKLVLPVVNVTIPAEWFFLVAATLLAGLHLMILLHEYYLLEKLAALPWKSRAVRTELFFPSISISGHFPREYPLLVGGISCLTLWLVYLLVPVATLVYLQMCSLRFRIPVIEKGISVCVTVSLLSSLYFVLAASSVKRRNDDLWMRGFGSPQKNQGVPRGGLVWRVVALWVVAFAFLLWFANSYKEMLRHPPTCLAEDRFLGVIPFSRYLVLTSIPKREEEESAEHARGINFRGLDLRCATFSVAGAGLVGVDFRGANLRGAVFRGVDLKRADFSGSRTNLKGASFVGSDLSGASFHGTSLSGATFQRVNMQRADLSGSDLSMVKAIGVNLVGADLTGSRLRGADLREALLAFARIDYASIELARFDDAWMDGASFKGSAAFGASFRGARLRGASGLPFAGIDLQSANVWHLNSCGDLSIFPAHVNMRDLRLEPVGDWRAVLAEVPAQRRSQFPNLTWDVLKVLSAQVANSDLTCFWNEQWDAVARAKGWPVSLREQNILYDQPRPVTPLAEWPTQPPVTEDEYLEGLIGELITKACAEASESPGKTAKESTLLILMERRAKDEVGRFGERLRQKMQAGFLRDPAHGLICRVPLKTPTTPSTS